MRTRTIMTVALLAAGCGTSGGARPAPAARAETQATAAPTPTPAPAPTTVTALPAPVTAAAAARPATPAATVPLGAEQLKGLAEELRYADQRAASFDREHFRPLCDAQGYPLVGNLITKSVGPGPVEYFCTSVREQAKS